MLQASGRFPRLIRKSTIRQRAAGSGDAGTIGGIPKSARDDLAQLQPQTRIADAFRSSTECLRKARYVVHKSSHRKRADLPNRGNGIWSGHPWRCHSRGMVATSEEAVTSVPQEPGVTEHPSSAEVLTAHTEGAAAAESRCIVCAGPLDESVGELFDTRFGIDGSYEARRCSRCGLEQLSPLPTTAEIKRLYESYYNFSGEKGTLYTGLRKWFFSSPLFRLWVRLDGDTAFHTRRGKGRLLDIGCNEGRGLQIYARNGFQVEGLELNERATAVARDAGFTVYTDALEDFIPATPYDVAVLSNVLEHALDPKAMLSSVRRLLQPKGQVWITCPNSRSWLRARFGPSWINWHVPFHIVHFSPQSLKHLLAKTGFTRVEIHQITPALWVASSLIARVFARRGKPTRQLRNPWLVFGLVLLARALLFPVFYFGNRLGRGDCLVAVAGWATDVPGSQDGTAVRS
jgi:2-polyprenyl-3-methyl-5-hydroxy-6-metoxy-1,4-benzoquinol methylase